MFQAPVIVSGINGYELDPRLPNFNIFNQNGDKIIPDPQTDENYFDYEPHSGAGLGTRFSVGLNYDYELDGLFKNDLDQLLPFAAIRTHGKSL